MAGGAVLAGLLLPACAPHGACPMYRVASGATVDPAPFVAAHPQASTLCATGSGCVPAGPDARPGVLRIPVTGPGTLRLHLTVRTRAGTILLSVTAQVPVRHHVIDAACGITADLGSVTITRTGALRLR